MTILEDAYAAKTRAQEERWAKVGHVVFDVVTLLENLPRISGDGLHEREATAFQQVQKYAVLVASHALKSAVLPEANDECGKYAAELHEYFA